MKKFINFIFSFILLISLLFLSISHYPKASSNLRLLENSPNNNELPDHFRMSSNYKNIIKYKGINLKGLDNLNISGSGQFSDSGLSLIKNAISNEFFIIDIDLRQESHGFINGIAVSWENDRDNANKGLSLSEVISTENKLLGSITLGKPITFFDTKRTIIPECVENELQVAHSKEIGYVRIPVTDGELPTNDMVNYFIDFVKNQPNDSWLHFHCKEGIGRTTTFMIMYDIIKNYKDVKLNDIIKRQVILSGMLDRDAETFYTGDHFKFLSDFYNSYTSKHQAQADAYKKWNSVLLNSI
ncbi:MAG: phytase [Clostridium sartagoforme]|nr:phytase [Clostridium sartagoforme]